MKSTLSDRQTRIGELVAQGYSNREIATEHNVTEQVVKNVLHSIFDKLGVWNRVELVNYFAKSQSSVAIDEARQKIDLERVKTARQLEILDTRFESIFDELALLARSICEAPVGVISLADSDRVWFKARVGLDLAEVPRDVSFCGHTIQTSEIFAVCDALKDPRFARNPLVVSHPKIRFYAGAPMITADGYAMGSMCVIDHVPRKLSPEQFAALKSLAKLALEQMEIRREMLQLRSSAAEPAKEALTA